MSTDTNEQDRTAALRRLLVATATATPPAPRRSWRRLGTIGLTIAGLLAGAAAGAGLTAAANADSPVLSSQSEAAIWVKANAQSYMTVVGEAGSQLGSGSSVIRLGTAPTRASEFSWTVKCLSGSGTIATRVGEQSNEPTSCHAGTTDGSLALVDEASGGELHVTVTGSVRWVAYYGWVASPAMPKASPAQHDEVSDGKVTRSEYLDAYNRFAGCMYAHGDPLVVPETTLFIDYAATDEYAIDWCYAAEFGQVDSLWQGEHPAPAGTDAGSWGGQAYDPATDPEYAQ